MADSGIQKLYCYVDETGQDTKGRIYVVAVIISVLPKQQLFELLIEAETVSGKGKLKWHKNSTRKRDAYVKKALHNKVGVQVYYQIFSGPEILYELATVQAAANAVQKYVRDQNITEYKATIIIDGLPRSSQGKVGKLLRGLGVRTKSVRGERDEANPAIRLADAVAGLIRQSHEGDKHFTLMKNQLEKIGKIQHLP